MKTAFWPHLMLVCLALCAAAVWPVAAQEAPAAPAPSAQTTPAAPPMTEEDRLPFMQSESAAAEPGSGGIMMRALGAMILIVGLIFGVAWGLKKLGPGGFGADKNAEGPDLTVLSTISIASGRTISTVRFGDKVLLVGATAQSFTLLAEAGGEEKSPVAGGEEERNPRSVAEMLAEEERGRALARFGVEFERAQRRLDAASDEEVKIA